MFYSIYYGIFTLLYNVQSVHFFSLNSAKTIGALSKKKNFHNKKTELKNEFMDVDLANSPDNNNNNETLVFIKKMKDTNAGFDFTKNTSFVAEKDELQKITNYFHKLKQLMFLESPFVSDIMKLKCAEEILKEKNVCNKHFINNNFWETFEDVFF